MRKPIVIIGGMGPQASLRFHQLLLEKSRDLHSGTGHEYPFIVHFSLPVKDFIGDESYKAAAAQQINSLAPVIARLEPHMVTLACNTAHLLIPEVTFLQQPSFISMIEIVARALARDGMRRVGLLASPTTLRTQLYEAALANQHIATITPDSRQQVQLEAAIRAVIDGKPLGRQRSVLHEIANSLVAQGAEAILLGCTELPLAFSRQALRVPTYDCLDLYADAVIARYYLYNEV